MRSSKTSADVTQAYEFEITTERERVINDYE